MALSDDILLTLNPYRHRGMDKLIIRGGQKLRGKVAVSGSKNAALPLMIACLLTDAPLVLKNIPSLADIATLAELLNNHGVAVDISDYHPDADNTLRLCAQNINNLVAPYDLVRKMRASVLVMGPLLARFRECKVSLPGGCAIGARPVDLHLKAFEQMGAEIMVDGGYIHARAPNGLRGADISFNMVSVGATENILMAATLADGPTIIRNAAREPEVTDLALCLLAMGAKIEGIGTSQLEIEGVPHLDGAIHQVIPDRIEAGSLLIAAAATGGRLELTNDNGDNLGALIEILRICGAIVAQNHDSLSIMGNMLIRPVAVETEPYPGFPTDLQAQLMAMLCKTNGVSVIQENIFENRFMHVPELQRLGANITLNGPTAVIKSVDHLTGAQVMATDLRASMSLVIAGLMAQGETTISRLYHLDRGYDGLDKKLMKLGADISRVQA